MESPREDSHPSKSASWLIVLIFLSPVVYLLSTGPMVLVYPHLPEFAQDVVELVYRPLDCLENFKPLVRIMERYLRLWK